MQVLGGQGTGGEKMEGKGTGGECCGIQKILKIDPVVDEILPTRTGVDPFPFVLWVIHKGRPREGGGGMAQCGQTGPGERF